MEHITKETFTSTWNYFLSIEHDLANTSRYIEPSGQETVHSFEFAKIIILACTEVESVMKSICFELTGEKKGNIGEYKEIILGRFPKITTACVTISRLGKSITPFEGWDSGPLEWWTAYGLVKHGRGTEFDKANYINAATSLSALYILIFYLSKICEIEFRGTDSEYIHSEYSGKLLACAPSEQLPDFAVEKDGMETILDLETVE